MSQAATTRPSREYGQSRPGGGRCVLSRLTKSLDDVDRLVAAERAGRLKQLGNWSLGQRSAPGCVVGFSYTSVPLTGPVLHPLDLRLRKRQITCTTSDAGRRDIPGCAGGTLAIDPVPLDEALDRFRRVIERLKKSRRRRRTWSLD